MHSAARRPTYAAKQLLFSLNLLALGGCPGNAFKDDIRTMPRPRNSSLPNATYPGLGLHEGRSDALRRPFLMKYTGVAIRARIPLVLELLNLAIAAIELLDIVSTLAPLGQAEVG